MQHPGMPQNYKWGRAIETEQMDAEGLGRKLLLTLWRPLQSP